MDPDTIRILLVEDDPTDAAFTRAMLGRVRHAPVAVTWVDTVEAALTALRTGEHDLVLVDYLLASRTGLDLVRTASEEGISTPMILLTGKGSRELDLEALHAGVADYLVKGRIDPGSLDRALRYALERARGRRELVESEARFRALVDHLGLEIVVVGADGLIRDVSPALADRLGVDRSRVVAEPLAAVLGDEGAADWASAAAGEVGGGDPVRVSALDVTGARVDVVGAPVPDGAPETGEFVLRLAVVQGP